MEGERRETKKRRRSLRKGHGIHSPSSPVSNAQSIIGKVDKLTCVANDTKLDLILVTESWCNERITNAFLKIPGYDRVRKDTAKGIVGGCWRLPEQGSQL